MTDPRSRFRSTPLFWICLPLAALLTWTVHELAHFQTGRWLGYEMWVSFNQAGSRGGTYASRADELWVQMAGPVVTYLQAALAFWWLRRRGSGAAYLFLFLAWFMRTCAFLVSAANPNDEASTSLMLGWPWWVLPSLACVALLVLLVLGSRRLDVGWRTNLGLYLGCSAMAAAIVLGDQALGLRWEG